MALNASDVSPGDDILASHHNSLIDDIEQHVHEGTDTTKISLQNLAAGTGMAVDIDMNNNDITDIAGLEINQVNGLGTGVLNGVFNIGENISSNGDTDISFIVGSESSNNGNNNNKGIAIIGYDSTIGANTLIGNDNKLGILIGSNATITVDTTDNVHIVDDTTVDADLDVTGTLSKGAGTFLIDHPLDRENKLLRHSFVESPDMKNIYDGVVDLNENGEAEIELPEYFTSLNKDYRYQLTSINKYCPLYIDEEIENNKFKIKSNNGSNDSGVKISWQVTGIRNDIFAIENRVKVEEIKGEGNKYKKGRLFYESKKDINI